MRNMSHGAVWPYQGAVKLFYDYAPDPHYDSCEQSAELFGQAGTESNRVTYAQPTEARPLKRLLSQRKVQDLFDLADLEVARSLESGRKGALAAWRDAIAFKTAYGWDLRSNELRQLQAPDLSHNGQAPYLGDHACAACAGETPLGLCEEGTFSSDRMGVVSGDDGELDQERATPLPTSCYGPLPPAPANCRRVAPDRTAP